MRALLSFHLIRDHCVKELVFKDYCVTIEKIFTLKNIYKNTNLPSLSNPHPHRHSLSSLPLSLTYRHLPHHHHPDDLLLRLLRRHHRRSGDITVAPATSPSPPSSPATSPSPPSSPAT
ncbi:hypothetical protein HanLR1_Chr15g0599111 [Helianthus annuus]|nr:hypothetical protein HanHA89_Chr15g0638191 [Helianthus annuus]KAJ0650734.1 hypothetical protein HanLR1_Chr15g0599111 [Helianthus annuus]